jgi:hypothetical protein
MLGIFLIYFIGKSYFDLAITHDKPKWPYAISGVIAYYLGTFIAGIVIYSVIAYSSGNMMENPDDIGISDFLLGLMAVPFGIAACWGLYKLLESRWSKSQKIGSHTDLLDDEI